MTSCAEVREVLPEHALGTLQPATRRKVDEHLAWCAGCRKEAAELTEGVAGLALSLPQPDPPDGLEDRVVSAVAASARRPRRRRGVVAGVLAAALVGASLTWGVVIAARDEPPDPRLSARDALRTEGDIQDLFEVLGGEAGVESLRFRPLGGAPARGWATRYTPPEGAAHQLVVLVGGLRSNQDPYTVVLRSAGAKMVAGSLEVLDGGRRGMWLEFGHPLTGFDKVVVEDAEGRRVLVGEFSS